MDSKKQKLPRNAAKTEFMTVHEKVISMLSEGLNKFNIYTILTEKHLIAMPYRTFCWNLQQLVPPERKKKKTIKPAPRVPLTVTAPKTGFLKPEDVDVKKLF